MAMPVKKFAADLSHILGTALVYSGGAALVCMAVVGTMSLDIVLLAYAEKNKNDFLTGWMLASILWRDDRDLLPMLWVSPLTSAIAIALSVALEVPHVGLAILAGWTVAATIFVVGLLFLAAEDMLQPEKSSSLGYSY